MSICIKSGDDGYTALHTRWVREGSPSGSFEELGEFGGRFWRVRRDDSGEPEFLLRASAGPTDPGLNKDVEWKATSGYIIDMNDTGLVLEEGPGGKGDLKISFEPFPYDETVWDPETVED